jgi:hypothetical protein
MDSSHSGSKAGAVGTLAAPPPRRSGRDGPTPLAWPEPVLTTVPAPNVHITCRRVKDLGSVAISVSGDVGAHDAAVLSSLLHTELEAHDPAGPAPPASPVVASLAERSAEPPQVLVVDLSEVSSYTPALPNLLLVARDRARGLGVGLHLLDLGTSGLGVLTTDVRDVGATRRMT